MIIYRIIFESSLNSEEIQKIIFKIHPYNNLNNRKTTKLNSGSTQNGRWYRYL